MTVRFLNTVALLPVILLLFCVAPASARAENVGLILPHDVYDYERIHESLTASLKRQGYAQKVNFLTQRPYPDPIALSNAARKLIAADVDIIISYGTAPTTAVLRERPRIPVLYAGVYEPIARDIDNKWATGVCSKLNISSLVRYLRASKDIEYLGVVYYSLEKESTQQMKELAKISTKYGYNFRTLDLKDRAHLTRTLNDLQADAMIVTSSLLANSSLQSILQVSASKRIPTASLISHEKNMAMITLISDPEEQGRLLANQLFEVLDGKSPQDIEPVCCRKIELVYNVKDAGRMGLKISMDLVTEATRLINQ
ncbi:MAG: ABC transporter substrate binding protein [Nitrospirota bacterium]|jgi:putative ABC transport system substrate-binding protein